MQKCLDNTSIIREINDKELVDLMLKYYDSLNEKDDSCNKRNRINGFSAKDNFNDEKKHNPMKLNQYLTF